MTEKKTRYSIKIKFLWNTRANSNFFSLFTLVRLLWLRSRHFDNRFAKYNQRVFQKLFEKRRKRRFECEWRKCTEY